MTGFGQARVSYEGGAIEVQLACVNHRSCQIQLRSELRDLGFEDQVRKRLREGLQRGAVTLQLNLQRDQIEVFNSYELQALYRRLAELAAEVGAPQPGIEAALPLLSRSGNSGSSEAFDEALLSAGLAAVEQALAACRERRAEEGEAIAADLRQRAADLGRLVAAMAQRAPQRLGPWREALRERLREAGVEGIDPELLARECALAADRIDVSEEMTRLAAHLSALDELLASPGDQAVGRPLEFLLQELGREVNTTGAKANDAALAALVLEAKQVLEQIREQAANLL